VQGALLLNVVVTVRQAWGKTATDNHHELCRCKAKEASRYKAKAVSRYKTKAASRYKAKAANR
jgi:hypothetical protein